MENRKRETGDEKPANGTGQAVSNLSFFISGSLFPVFHFSLRFEP